MIEQSYVCQRQLFHRFGYGFYLGVSSHATLCDCADCLKDLEFALGTSDQAKTRRASRWRKAHHELIDEALIVWSLEDAPQTIEDTISMNKARDTASLKAVSKSLRSVLINNVCIKSGAPDEMAGIDINTTNAWRIGFERYSTFSVSPWRLEFRLCGHNPLMSLLTRLCVSGTFCPASNQSC
ncbi:hypothetical protein [Methylobacterium trifolii]|uniref:hypothetical protein n=1 Tax=Methylobacterium trifolii TaxID=1003092 RepID=UPI001EDDCDFD|nr:hypothetical protein [Methylobacterium trifolii]